jgi:sulfatase maturation enzyme AslB (radical SAM superfamily)
VPLDVSRISLVLTAACNLGCAYCYQNAKQPRRMTWETLRAALDLLGEVRGPEVRVLFTGGEPLLEFDLIDRAVRYARAVAAPGLRIRYEIVTNGTRLGDLEAAFLSTHDFEVQLGFDGVAAAQNLRGRVTFHKLDALLDRLREQHPAFYRNGVSVAVTLVPETIPSLADSVSYFLRKDVGEVLITPAITWQRGWSDDALPELDRQFRQLYRASLQRYRESGEVPLLLFRKTGRRVPPARRPIPMCPVADRRQVVVDVDGRLYGCVLLAESYQRFPSFLQRRFEPLRMGDVHEPNLSTRIDAFGEAVRATDIFRAKEKKRSSYARCADCRYLRSCEICPGAIGHQPDNDDPDRMPDFPCAVTRIALKYRARFPRQGPTGTPRPRSA